ncbi:MAG: hypothetical protein Q6K70_09030 [Thermostichales cyanobacterium DRC_bins_46]
MIHSPHTQILLCILSGVLMAVYGFFSSLKMRKRVIPLGVNY